MARKPTSGDRLRGGMALGSESGISGGCGGLEKI
jgi:hypothetical protein